MNPYVVDAALLAAIATVMVAIINVLVKREVLRTTRVDREALARLQTELRTTEERLRNELARDLAAHESVLRVQSEVRLKLFERSAVATTEACRAISNAVFVFIGHAARADGPMPDSVLELFSALTHIAVFLPPELDGPFEAARSEVAMAVQMVPEARKRGDVDVAVVRKDAVRRAAEARRSFERAARSWKLENWNATLGIPTPLLEEGPPANAP